MSRSAWSLLTVGIILNVASSSLALPTYGANCQSCHTGNRGTITITANDTTANPVEACSVPDRGTLPVFVVAPGGTRALTATLSGISNGTNYALVFKGLESNAVQHCGVFAYSDDPLWNKRSASPPVYYTQPLTGLFFTWPSQSTYNFNLVVGASTPADYYDLVFAVAGLDGQGTFYHEVHFYVQVAVPAPTILLNPTTLSPTIRQGLNVPDGSFTVANSGGGTLNYTIVDDAAWLSETPTSGSTNGPANPITVHYATSTLAPGTYIATITVSDPNATNNPQTVTVTLTVTPLIDIPTFVNVLLGIDTNPNHVAASDIDGNGIVNGLDIRAYLIALFGG